MGKGDQRTRRGKIYSGTSGKTRPSKRSEQRKENAKIQEAKKA